MSFRLGRLGVALVAACLLTTGPASANPAESQEDSLESQLGRVAAKLKAESERALDAASQAAARAVEDSKGAIAEAEKDLAPQLQTFRQMLNEQKARFAIIGEDAAARLDAWRQAASEYWSETWADPWAETWAEMQRSTAEALDWFSDWIDKHSGPNEQTETPV